MDVLRRYLLRECDEVILDGDGVGILYLVSLGSDGNLSGEMWEGCFFLICVGI